MPPKKEPFNNSASWFKEVQRKQREEARQAAIRAEEIRRRQIEVDRQAALEELRRNQAFYCPRPRKK